ncbi:hypothetical protein [Corynebacterium ulcerans]|uniref:hypothetical protein n=1 Tax=Corynebacterium ulcerans TaxID=65058 RepID=UPI0003C79CA9|nr:hypothetical protein [Corynebacterium ulcerans]AIT89181.1 Hypothetical protein Cul210932_1235 [Corynebacterium ulcerans]ALD94958.1 Hypothetical protein Cul131001_1254 [Corynebacterium ulcerans]ESU57568.1 hypothetical protein D881_07155 [Corynebacterium ulcerans NCTC 12077]SQG58810.1 Uncharacterised protein [Corynebacterium ulcerans]BBJ74456.1 hypothetical protein CULCFH20161_12830 [Corynebacterium ulcerans]
MHQLDHLNAARLAFKKVREGLIEAAHAAGMIEADLVNLLSTQPEAAPEEQPQQSPTKPENTDTPEPEPEAAPKPAEAPAPVVAKTYTHDDAKAEVTDIARSLTNIEDQQRFSQTVQSILQKFGAEKLSQLPTEKIADFINTVKENA